MRSQRLLWFLVMIALGVALGLVYGWILRPPVGAGASPENLRADYKADYALMTAEIFAANGDMSLARARLDTLGADSPAQAVEAALETARSLEYPQADIDIMEHLLQALQEAAP